MNVGLDRPTRQVGPEWCAIQGRSSSKELLPQAISQYTPSGAIEASTQVYSY